MTLYCFGCQTTLGHMPMMNQIFMIYILILAMYPGPMFQTELQVCALSFNEYFVSFLSTVSLCCPFSGSRSTLNLTIQTRGNVSSVNSQPVLCEVVGSLISIFREFRALCLLRNGPMLRPLLAPHVSFFTHSLDGPSDLDAPVSLALYKQCFLIFPHRSCFYLLLLSLFLVFISFFFVLYSRNLTGTRQEQ